MGSHDQSQWTLSTSLGMHFTWLEGWTSRWSSIPKLAKEVYVDMIGYLDRFKPNSTIPL